MLQVADEDLTREHRALTGRVADDDRFLYRWVAVHDAQPVRIDKAHDDPLGSEELCYVGKQALVEDLGLLDAPAQPVDRDALPRSEKLRELVDLVAKRDALSVVEWPSGAAAVAVLTIMNRPPRRSERELKGHECERGG